MISTTKTDTKRHWWVLVGCSGMSAASLGFNVNSIGVFFTPVADALNISRGSFALHSTIATFTMAIVYLMIPKILEQISFKKLLYLGVIISAVSTMAMSLTTNLWVFYILGALRGLGAGFFGVVPVTMILNNWFEDKNGTVMSIAFASAGVAGAIMSPLFTNLIYDFGWQWAFVVAGILICLLNIPSLIFSSALTPEEEGYLPYRNTKTTETTSNKPNTKKQKILRSKPISYTNLGFIALFIISFLYSALVGMVQHFPGLAQSLNFSANIGAVMLSSAMLGNIFFKLFTGVLSDKIGIIKSFVFITLLNFISMLLMINFQNIPIMLFSAFLFGSVYTFSTIGLPLLTNSFFGRSQSMQIYPILSFVSTIGKAIALSFIGYIYDFTGSYINALLLAVLFQIINFALLYLGVKVTSRKMT